MLTVLKSLDFLPADREKVGEFTANVDAPKGDDDPTPLHYRHEIYRLFDPPGYLAIAHCVENGQVVSSRGAMCNRVAELIEFLGDDNAMVLFLREHQLHDVV